MRWKKEVHFIYNQKYIGLKNNWMNSSKRDKNDRNNKLIILATLECAGQCLKSLLIKYVSVNILNYFIK